MQDAEQDIVKVNILDVQVCDDGEIICNIKDEIKQDPKPNGKNTFRIYNEVFVYDYETGFVYNVGSTKMEPELGKKDCKMTSNVVCLPLISERHFISWFWFRGWFFSFLDL